MLYPSVLESTWLKAAVILPFSVAWKWIHWFQNILFGGCSSNSRVLNKVIMVMFGFRWIIPSLDKNIFQMHRYKNKGLDFPVTSYFSKSSIGAWSLLCTSLFYYQIETSWGKHQARCILYLLCRIQLWKVQFIVVNRFVQTVVNVQLQMIHWFISLHRKSLCAMLNLLCSKLFCEMFISIWYTVTFDMKSTLFFAR